MTITEAKRLELHQDLRNTIGVEAADTLMEHLPPTGWADVARRSDLDHQTAVTAGEFALVRSEMSAEFGLVRSEMAAEFAAVRNEMSTEFTAVRSELTLAISEMKGHIDNRLSAQTRWIVTLTSANTLAMVGLIVSVLLKL